MRIHAQSLASATYRRLRDEARACANGTITQYAMKRLRQRQITVVDIRAAIREGELIEYHSNEEEGWERCLLRCDTTAIARSVCVVVDLTTRDIVTVYENAADDNHRTLRTGEYLLLRRVT